jgi:hypothetical protein
MDITNHHMHVHLPAPFPCAPETNGHEEACDG